MTATTVDLATVDDLPELMDIYNYYVASAHSNFDTEPTTLAQRRTWFATFDATGPHRLLVARQHGTVVGYASSRPYRDHPAFVETVEFGISLHPDCRSQGVGTLLYTSLLACLDGEPIHLTVAGIALPNEASVAFHRKFGFNEVGVFHEYAIKNGVYLSSLWMQRLL